MSVSVGLKLVSSLLESGDKNEYAKLRVNKDQLRPIEAECFDFIEEFLMKHKALPKKETLAAAIPGVLLPQTKEVPSYYAEQVYNRFVVDTLKKGYQVARDIIAEDIFHPEKAVEALTETLMEIHKNSSDFSMMDFKESKDYLLKEYKRKKVAGLSWSILTGYPSVDDMSGGLEAGDVLSIVGRPALGKTFMGLSIGHRIWFQQHKTVLFVSLEMSMLKIQQRLASLHTKHNLTQIKKAQLPTKGVHDLWLKLEQLQSHDSSYWVVDANMAATVDDIWKLCLQVNPDVLVIDGAYLLTHPNPRLSKFDRVGENMRGIKKVLATQLGIPVICSWQFNRETIKKLQKSKEAKVGLEDIGYSDEIGQISSIVLGMTQAESVETISRRKVEIMKGRDGEEGEFFINLDFFAMDFSEVPPEDANPYNTLTIS